MTLQEAIDADGTGFAIAYDADGRIVAEVQGPAHYLSKRKRKKRGMSAEVWIWTPSKPNIEFGYLVPGCRVRRQKLGVVAKDKRRWLESLDWHPRQVRSVIDRLAKLARRL